MEKLIELLNQFEDTDNWENGYQVKFRESKIISKKFGFVKWLVLHDKINKDLISRVLIRAYITPTDLFGLKCEFHDYYESLLMRLSIQENPIEFLISLLK